MFPIEIRRWLELVEDRVNALSDDGQSWWPFSFLKPAVHLPLTTPRVLALSILYAVPACLIAAVMGHGMGDRVSGNELARIIVAATMAFFMVFQCSFALVWNRRARRLQTERARRSMCAADD